MTTAATKQIKTNIHLQQQKPERVTFLQLEKMVDIFQYVYHCQLCARVNRLLLHAHKNQ